jgi:hypothetical protein
MGLKEQSIGICIIKKMKNCHLRNEIIVEKYLVLLKKFNLIPSDNINKKQ